MVPRPRSAAPAADFEIWQAGGRLLSIDSPVRLKILRHLKQGPRTLNELVAATHKSKPTLSALHMPPLLKSGLVAESPDPRDSRVKWYRLVGTRLGTSQADPSELQSAVVGYAQGRGLLPFASLLEALDLNTLLASPDREYVKGVASRLGTMIGKMLTGLEPERRAAEINRLLEQERQGSFELHQGKPRVKPQRAEAKEFWERVVEVAMDHGRN